MKRLSVLCAVFALSGCQGHPLPEPCYQKPESGRCRAAITRYYFEPDEMRCKAFIWGGCGGAVPFDSAEVCMQQCDAAAPDNDKPLMEKRND